MSDIPQAPADGRSSHWQLQRIVSQLRGAREDWRARN
ncbi:serine acetyltransferase, partial [Pseudomonas syringae pv. actinidiae]